MTSQISGSRIRWYPTSAQAQALAREFGGARWAYNKGLETMTRTYRETGRGIGYVEFSRQLTQMKREPDTAWLREVSSNALGQSLRDLDEAMRNFFPRCKSGEKPGYPRFKSRKAPKQSVAYSLDWRQTGLVEAWAKGHVKLPRVGKVRPRWTGNRPAGRPKMVTISREGDTYWISMNVEQDVPELPPSEAQIGIDLGLKSYATLSTGEKIEPPKVLGRNLRRLAIEQRKLSKKVKGSNRRAKQAKVVAKLHRKISNMRRDWLQKLSTRLIIENQVICLEDLNVAGMVRNRTLAAKVSDAAWSEFVRQIEYKAKWYGRTVVKINRFFPSSKTCSACGFVHENLELKDRSWKCPGCGAEHDRDLNAARNILAEGLRRAEVPARNGGEGDRTSVTPRPADLASRACPNIGCEA